MTVAAYRAYAASTFGDRADEFLTLCPAATDGQSAEQYNAYARDEERVSTPWTDEDHAIADTTSSYAANFVATGNPDGRSLPAWPPCARRCVSRWNSATPSHPARRRTPTPSTSS